MQLVRLLRPHHDQIPRRPPSAQEPDQVIRFKVTRVGGEVQRGIQEPDVGSATRNVSAGHNHGLLARSETAGAVASHDVTSDLLARCYACC